MARFVGEEHQQRQNNDSFVREKVLVKKIWFIRRRNISFKCLYKIVCFSWIAKHENFIDTCVTLKL